MGRSGDQLNLEQKIALARFALEIGLTNRHAAYEWAQTVLEEGCDTLTNFRETESYQRLLDSRQEADSTIEWIRKSRPGSNVHPLNDQIWFVLRDCIGIRREEVEPILMAQKEGMRKSTEIG